MAATDVVRRYFELINADRFESLREIFASDIALEMPGAARRDGVDAAVAYYARALAPLPVHDDDPVSIIASADDTRVAVEIDFTGATADGRPVVFTAVDLFDMDADGHVVRLRSFYDTARVAELLDAPAEH